VFDRLSAYGLELVGPFGEKPQAGCKCGRGDACRHIRTFAHHRKPSNSPNQLDFVFATENMRREPVSCVVLPEADDPWTYSDHLAVFTTLNVPPA
jgi:endonuclease/exonuclease/phosphatase family metal-dependent hydrolase